ncbi:MAG: hypothetical protein ACI8XO_005059 [Verrucomicrobiales bacterium]
MPTKSQNSGCLALLAKLLGKEDKSSSSQTGPPPYGKCDHFLSAAEISFYHVLKCVIDHDLTLLCKVRLGDLFYVRHIPHLRTEWEDEMLIAFSMENG